MIFDDEFRILRDNFLLGSPRRLDEMRSALELLETDDSNREVLGDLHRAFHSLVGLGTTYGFPSVSGLARQGEANSLRLIRSDTNPTPDDLEDSRGLVNAIESELRHGADEPFRPFTPVTSVTGEIRRRTALIVEDDPEMLGYIKSIVEQEGIAIVDADCVEAATKKLSERLPDILIVDVRLPDGLGYEVVAYLRRLPGGEMIPAVITSVLTGFLDRVEAIRSGANAYFEKPINRDPFVRRLRHLIHREISESNRVLYVEDDPDYAALIKSILERAGYKTRVCTDPRRFEEVFSAFKPDLVILDIILPGMSGYELARYLRQDEANAVLPILFLTTDTTSRSSIASVTAGGDDHLTKPVNPVLLLKSVAARIERSRFLRELLDRDGLTGLLTHTRWMERVGIAMKDTERHLERPSVIVMVDIDRFKGVNDRHGHVAGDRILSSLGSYLRKRLRQSDDIGRYGGDEFGIILRELGESDAARLMQSILEEFSDFAHPVSEEEMVSVTLSMGIAEFDRVHMTSVAEWIERADEALYRAKDAGGNQLARAGATHEG